MDSKTIPIGELVEYSVGGGWGKDEPQEDYQSEVAVIRGADFPNVQQGVLEGLPMRWEKDTKAARAALRPGDIVIEISGGTNERPTGRTLYITDELLDRYSCPVIPASFCRLMRPNDKIDSAYLYYWLQEMYLKGRTWGYQNRSTGLSNFQYKVFSKFELVTVPDRATQHRITQLLTGLDKKRHLNRRQNDYLAQLCETVTRKYCESGTDCLNDICHQVTDKVNCQDANLETYVSTESLLQNKQGRQRATSLPATGKVTCYAAGDTLISNIRPYFKKIWYAPFDGTCSGDVLVFRANCVEHAPYLHACLHQDRFFDYVMRGAKGTKMPRGDKRQMMEFNVSATCEPNDLSLLNAALSRIVANDIESASLEELRDALLPKLMSGAIDISKVDSTQLNNHLVDMHDDACVKLSLGCRLSAWRCGGSASNRLLSTQSAMWQNGTGGNLAP